MPSQDGLIPFHVSYELAPPSVAFAEPGEEAALHLPGRCQAAVLREMVAS